MYFLIALHGRRQSRLLRVRVGGGVGWVEEKVKVCWIRMEIVGMLNKNNVTYTTEVFSKVRFY